MTLFVIGGDLASMEDRVEEVLVDDISLKIDHLGSLFNLNRASESDLGTIYWYVASADALRFSSPHCSRVHAEVACTCRLARAMQS